MSTSRGFTVMELLVVIAIIGVLSGVVLGIVGAAREKARIVRAKAEIKTLYEALLRYNIDTGTWPSCGVGSSNLEDISSDPEVGWNGPWKDDYINQPIGNDPWGTSYFYDGCPDAGYECAAGASSICSAGPDRGYESFNETDMIANDDDVCIYFKPAC